MSPSTMIRRRSGLYVPQVASSLLSVMLADGPKALWMMNDAASPLLDSSGNALDMSVSGSPTAYSQSPSGGPSRTGISWPATTTDGASTASVVETGNPTVYALETWAYMLAAPAATTVNLLQIQVTSTQYATIRMLNSRVCRVQMQSTGGVFKDSAVLALNTWHHLVLKYNAGAFYSRVNKTNSSTGSKGVGLLNAKAYSHLGTNTGASSIIIGPSAYYSGTVPTDAQFDAHYDTV